MTGSVGSVSRTWLKFRRSRPGCAAVGALRNLEWNTADVLCRMQIGLGMEPTVIRTARAALEQWKRALAGVPPPSKGGIIVAGLRNRTWVEWSVFACCYLYRMGYQPVLLHSGREVAGIYSPPRLIERMGVRFWEAIPDLPQLQLVNLDEHLPAEDDAAPEYAEFAQRHAHTIAAYDLRVEEFEDGEDAGEYRAALGRSEQMLRRYAQAIARVFSGSPHLRVICPSGLIGWSLALREAAGRLGRNVIFVEGWAIRPGHMIWNLNRPALHTDLEGWSRLLGKWDDSKETDARDFLAFQERAEVDREAWLENFHPVQRSQKLAPLPAALQRFLRRPGPCFLLATNVVGDSTTLGQATIFRSQRDWLQHVSAFFSLHPQFNLVIRAHPDEVWVNARQRMGQVARRLVGDAVNIFVIDGDQDANTYAIVDHIQAGLAWVSTIGVDMILRGKPVVLAARARYASLGIGYSPQTVEEYFRRILELAAHLVPPDREMVLLCKIYQRIVFKMISLQATGKRYLSHEYRLGGQGMHPDQEVFYRILAGELSDKGLPLTTPATTEPQEPPRSPVAT